MKSSSKFFSAHWTTTGTSGLYNHIHMIFIQIWPMQTKCSFLGYMNCKDERIIFDPNNDYIDPIVTTIDRGISRYTITDCDYLRPLSGPVCGNSYKLHLSISLSYFQSTCIRDLESVYIRPYDRQTERRHNAKMWRWSHNQRKWRFCVGLDIGRASGL